jgi:hypothetical protein
MDNYAPLAAVVVMLSTACSGSSGGPGSTSSGGPSGADSATVDDRAATTAALLDVPTEGDGFQVNLPSFDVQPSEEAYYCYRLPMPVDEAFDLSAVESRFSLGAHHLLLSTVDEAYEAGQGACDASQFGYDVPIGEAMQNNLRFLSGAQTPYADDPRTKIEFEEGMAFQLKSDTTLLAQLHWVNTTTDVQHAATTINFLYAKTETTMPLDSFFFYHTDIQLPPQSASEVGGRCTFPAGDQIVSMVSHMHARGVDFTVHRNDGSDAELLYEEDSWSEPQMKFWPVSDLLQVQETQTLDYRCFFDNTTADWIYDGDGAGEEMCMLIGLYTGGSGTIWGFPGMDFPGNACQALPEGG